MYLLSHTLDILGISPPKMLVNTGGFIVQGDTKIVTEHTETT